MKKLLLLLALALTTAASFAQSPRPAAVTPQASSDEEFEQIMKRYYKFREFMDNDIQAVGIMINL